MPIVARAGRIDRRVPIVLVFDGERITRETCNVGLGGVFVATPEPAPVGKRVSLELTLPDWNEPLVVDGEIRWTRTSENGPDGDSIPGVFAKFLKPHLYVVAALANFVRSHAPGA
jgi:PilZ domain